MKKILSIIILVIASVISLYAQKVDVYQDNKIIATFDVGKIDSLVFKNPSIAEPVILVGEFPFTTSNPKADIQTALNTHFGELQPYMDTVGLGNLWTSSETINAFKITLIPEKLVDTYQWYNNNALGEDENWDIKQNPNKYTFTGVTTVTYNNTTYKVYGKYDINGVTWEYRIKNKS